MLGIQTCDALVLWQEIALMVDSVKQARVVSTACGCLQTPTACGICVVTHPHLLS